VTCDHPYVQALLAETPELRDAVAQVFDEGYKRVVFNGSTVSIERDADYRPQHRDFQLLKRIHAASARLEDEMPSRFGDPFLWKALLVEGVIWGLGGYAIGAAVEMFINKEDHHISHMDVVKAGMTLAAIAFVVLIALIVLGMRGSSRGHRVIVESALVLLIALPTSGIQIVGDTNRALDKAPPILVSRTINQCEMREHRGRRGRRWFSYHLWLGPAPAEAVDPVGKPPPALPPSIEIARVLCDASTPGGTVELTISPAAGTCRGTARSASARPCGRARCDPPSGASRARALTSRRAASRRCVRGSGARPRPWSRPGPRSRRSCRRA